MTRTLERLGLFQTQPRLVEAQSPAAIRRYVAMGFGIGLIAVSRSNQPDPQLHEISMGSDLGYLTVYAIRRKGAIETEASREFISIAKSILDHPRPDVNRRASRIRGSGPRLSDRHLHGVPDPSR